MILIVDVGNTNIKFAIFDGDKLLEVYSFPTHDQINLSKISSNHSKIDKAYIGSVVPSVNKKIIDKIYRTYKVNATLIRQKDFTTQFNLNKFNLNEIGMDILALCQFIKIKHKSGVGICFGTATFAVCVKNKTFYGAMIAPSIETSVKHLHDRTELIKPQSIAKLNRSLGFDTQTALQSGAFHMADGFVDNVLCFALQKYGIKKAYITGGKLKEIKILNKKNVHFVNEAII
jgi:type III pantothenate kinase